MNNMDYLWIFDKVWDLVAMAHGRMLVEFCPIKESFAAPAALECPEIEENDIMIFCHIFISYPTHLVCLRRCVFICESPCVV